MKCRLIAAGIAYLLSGVFPGITQAQEGASPAKPAWFRALVVTGTRAPSFVNRRFALAPHALPPLAPDSWNVGNGNWSLGTNWTAGTPNSLSAVTIGNTSGVTVTEDQASATAGTLSIVNSNALTINSGNTLTISGATSVASGSYLEIGSSGAANATVTSGGSFTNAGTVYVGNSANTSSSKLAITGTLTNTGGVVQVAGGSSGAGNSLISVTGAAPSILAGTYNLNGSTGSAAVEFGSGTITSIGDGASNYGTVSLNGSKAYLETGATNSNSALAGLTTIASNGALYLSNGASVTTTGGLANNDAYLEVDANGSGGSSLTVGGSLTINSAGDVYVGNIGMTSAATLKASSINSISGSVQLTGGSTAGAAALLDVTSAAPSNLTGYYSLIGNTGSAALEFASGSITTIGSGAFNTGSVTLNGADAYVEAGATHSNSALTGLTTLAGGILVMDNGASLTTTGALTNNDGYLQLDSSGAGGSTLNVGGALNISNTGADYVGNSGMTSPSLLKVSGTINAAGGNLQILGGSTAAATALVNVASAAPATLTGTYNIDGGVGSAALEFGSGSITSIGSGPLNSGDLTLNGANAYVKIGAANNESALTGLTTIAGGGLFLYNGASLTTTTALTNTDGYIEVGSSGPGGGTLDIGGSLTNTSTGDVYVGNGGMTSASTIKVSGTFNNTGGNVQVQGSGSSTVASLLNVTGAAPSSLTGSYNIIGGTGSAAVEFGSGSVTSIGSGPLNSGDVTLNGANAYIKIGAANNESALTGLTTLAGGGLFLYNGASLTTTTALTNTDGYLELDTSGSGGGIVNIGGSLTNTATGDVFVGNSGMTSASTLKVSGTLDNTGGNVQVQGGGLTTATALLNITGAAPATLTGDYSIYSGTGSAAVKFGSGSITSIGDGGSNGGYVNLYGPGAYLEIGATNSNSALTGLKTIATNGQLNLNSGSSVTTTSALTNAGYLQVDNGGTGGSTFTSNGALTNNSIIQIGSSGLASTAILNTAAAFTNGIASQVNLYTGGVTGANAVWDVTGPTIANAGTISLNGNVGEAEIEIGANVTTSGAGSIQMSNIATNLITGSASTFTLTNGSTIEGSGTISNMGIVNTGTISANQSTPLLILPSSLGLNNKGTLSVSANETMKIGTSAGGALTNFSGTTLTGGTYAIAAGGTMQFGASGANIDTLGGSVSLTGAGAQLINFGGTSLLTNLATITSTGGFTLGASWGAFTTTGNFTNSGLLSVGAGDKFIVNLADHLTNFSGTTLTGGTYKVTGTLQFAGANIVTNAASITLTGANSKISGTGGANGLANFAVNSTGASFTLGTGRSFTTAGNFTNNGSLVVSAGDTFDVNGNLTNFSSSTLTGGAYTVDGTLQFNGASIVSNAANITLGSTTAKIQNQSGTNAMLGFNTNTAGGKFTLSGNANLTTTGGSFTNAGTVTVNTGSTFTVGGGSFNFTQTAGTSTIDGTLANNGSGALDLNGGNLYGTGTLDYGVVDSATITPGNSSAIEGKLQVNGTYAQNSAGALDVTIGGTTAGTKYDQINISGAASLSGTLNITLAAGYTPAIGNTFDIVNASSISGTFTTVNGLAINGSEHFTVTTVSGDEIVLTVVSGAASAASATLSSFKRPVFEHGGTSLGVYSGHKQLATVPGSTLASIVTPIGGAAHKPVAIPVLRPHDDLSSLPVAPSTGAISGVSTSTGLSGVSALGYNPMASMNHMRFECGVDLGALRKTGGKRLLRGLWASPDSAEAVNIGYMTLTTH